MGEPVPLTILALQLELLLDDLVDLLFLGALESADEIFEILKSLHIICLLDMEDMICIFNLKICSKDFVPKKIWLLSIKIFNY